MATIENVLHDIDRLQNTANRVIASWRERTEFAEAFADRLVAFILHQIEDESERLALMREVRAWADKRQARS